MKKTGLVGGLGEDVWIQVFECLEINDFLKLKAVSKDLKALADSYTEIYERECLRIFSSDLNLFRYVFLLGSALSGAEFSARARINRVASICKSLPRRKRQSTTRLRFPRRLVWE